MHPVLTYIIDDSDKVVSINSEFTAFAKEGNAASLEYSVHGKSIWNFIGIDKLQILYMQLFDGVRKKQKEVNIHFRCDNAKVMKFMNMIIEPMPENALKISTKVLREITRKKALGREVFYLGILNGIPMCSNCNKIKIDPPIGWIEIEKALNSDLISKELNVAFDLCETCEDYFKKTIEKLED